MITEQDVRNAIGSVCENLDAGALPVDADFGDAGLDSLDHASVLLELHEMSGIEFPEDVDQLKSISAILRFVQTAKS